jgi:GT2 family glycosyltransferase
MVRHGVAVTSGPRASVVVACHSERRWPLIVTAIDSILNQDAQPIEVVVAVDHNHGLRQRIADRFPNVRVVANDGGRGASCTRNVGVRATRDDCDVVVFLDDDARATDGWLGCLLEPFESKDVVGSGGGVDPDWERGRPHWFPDEFGWVVGASYRGMPTTKSDIRNVWSENMAVRRDAFEAVGGFREGFGKMGERSRPEDTDLCIRVAEHGGGRWIFVPEARVFHHVPTGRSSFRFFVRRCYSEGKGKVEMAQLLRSEQPLLAEREYVRHTLFGGIAREVREGITLGSPRSIARAASIVAGAAAAGAGSAAGLLAASKL